MLLRNKNGHTQNKQICLWCQEEKSLFLNIITLIIVWTYALCHLVFVCLIYDHQVGLNADRLWLHSDPVSRRNNSVNEEVPCALVLFFTKLFYNLFVCRMRAGHRIAAISNHLTSFCLVWLGLMSFISLFLLGGETLECSGFSFEKPQRFHRCSNRLPASAAIVVPAFPASSANPWCCYWESPVCFHQQVNCGSCNAHCLSSFLVHFFSFFMKLFFNHLLIRYYFNVIFILQKQPIFTDWYLNQNNSIHIRNYF